MAIHLLDSKAESSVGNKVMQVASVTATLWSIAFAAVVGPMLNALALYYAELSSY